MFNIELTINTSQISSEHTPKTLSERGKTTTLHYGKFKSEICVVAHSKITRMQSDDINEMPHPIKVVFKRALTWISITSINTLLSIFSLWLFQKRRQRDEAFHWCHIALSVLKGPQREFRFGSLLNLPYRIRYFPSMSIIRIWA